MQVKPTFLNQLTPFITSMILKETPDEARFAIKNSIYDGADAIGVQLERMRRELRTEENLKAVFAAAANRPIYITNYWNAFNEGFDDDELMRGLVEALGYGATLGDIPGHTFDRDAEIELTKDPKAIEKQMKLIDKIHSMGKEVLMSTHICHFIPAEEVLEIALEQQRRGADISKIVTGANSDEEMAENLRITTLLKKELDIPFLFLALGTHTKVQRMIGPMLGCVTYLAVPQHDERAVPTQPTVRAAKAVRDNFDYMPDIADI